MNPFAKALALAVTVPAGALLAARNFGQWMIGSALGLYVAPAVVERVLALAPWIALGIAWSICLGLGFAWVLRRCTGTSRATAFYAGPSAAPPRGQCRASVPAGASTRSLRRTDCGSCSWC